MRPDLLVFDVNETLLDLGALRPSFAEHLGSTDPMGEWFARMLHGSLVANHVRRHRPFGRIGVEALLAVAARRGIPLDENGALEVVAGMRTLPPHPEVPGALATLRDAGFQMVTLTNGAEDAASEQLANAGIDSFFDRSFSVDAVRRFKPAPEPYLHVAAVMDADLDRMVMVAAHDWDVAGARSVGIPGAFLARPGAIWSLPDDPPALVAPDLATLAVILTGNTGPA